MYEKFVKTLRSYGLTNGTTLGRHMGIMDEAADVIEKLENELVAERKNKALSGYVPQKAIENVAEAIKSAYQQRDAAVGDLEEIMFKGGQNTDTCMYCAATDCYNRGGAGLCNPRWRGKKEAEGNDNE